MADRDITLWLDERWYDALTQHLKGGSVQEKLEEMLDDLINQLPDDVYERVSRQIWEEKEQARVQAENNRRFSVFKVTERGEENCYLVDEPIEFLHAATALRRYLKSENISGDFRHYYAAAQDISLAAFEQYAFERAGNTGRVVGTFDIDLDRGEFSTMDNKGCWQRFSVKDVCTVAYHAERKAYAPMAERLSRLLDHLDGKELPQHAPIDISM